MLQFLLRHDFHKIIFKITPVRMYCERIYGQINANVFVAASVFFTQSLWNDGTIRHQHKLASLRCRHLYLHSQNARQSSRW